ncbi:sphingosine phosphate lyase, putative [Perkinsus marinus ATCC 50983]|uniref:Sphingosine phosphate lyase, putative n=1 Tax=Perkinsus marinus (strain ATCC 50983 / TXsc) TaxID=423536 RepID=C5L2Y7_PERM5|nr:sphingosine phosphate lyase, putative [Perkinsus marinus ATCC 50983]EER08874.1 sphingosine phosphate lyase, putative [Perkinsus marinus ATCC 50983]|eukprot:XP_002777058.1 sphingosine phosphate lyase, putative [Perkinsus marinus ATCC 50983]
MPSSSVPIVSNLIAAIRLLINDRLRGKDRFDTVVLSTFTWFVLLFAYRFWKYSQRYGLHQGFEVPLKRYALNQARHIPQIRAKIDAELDKATEGLDEMVLKDVEPRNNVLPKQGKSSSELIPHMEKCAEKEHMNWKNGGQSGCVYHGGEELYEMQGKVLGMFGLSNLLHADVFTKTRQMEAEVIAMTLNLFNGKPDEGACGSVTSGGTESILLAMKAYRDWGRVHHQTSSCRRSDLGDLMHIGRDGYKESCKTIGERADLSAAKHLEKGINDIEGVRVLGRPSVSVVAITCTNGVNDYDFAEWLKNNTKTHWNLNMLQMPSGVHICVTRLNAKKMDELLTDIEAGLKAEKAKLDAGVKSGHSGNAAVYGSAASVPKELADIVVAKYLDTCYKA